MAKKVIDSKLMIRRFFLLMLDIVIIVVSSWTAIIIRFDFKPGNIDQRFIESIWSYMPINVIVTLLIFNVFRMYKSLWRFAGLVEMLNIFSACVIATGVQLVGLKFLNYPVPRSYHFLYFALILFMTIISRFLYRFLRATYRRIKNGRSTRNVMVIGAGKQAMS